MSSSIMQDNTDLTLLVGEPGRTDYGNLVRNCFTSNEGDGNVTLGDLRGLTLSEFMKEYGTTSQRRTRLKGWVAHYGLGPYFKPSKEAAVVPTVEVAVQTWTDDDLALLKPRSRVVDNTTADLVGRKPALDFFDSHLRKNPIVADKGEFKVFVASGHVRAGKTRLGEELGKHLTKSALYVQLELSNGHGYRTNFDGRNKDNHEERLGGRLLRAYFDTNELKPISANKVLDRIFSLNPGKNSVVVHVDEHGAYVRAAAKDKDVGAERSKEMLTAFFGVLSAYERDSRKIVYPVASGTTYDDVAVDHDSHYHTFPLPLVSLNLKMSLKLAGDRLRKKGVDGARVKSILEKKVFQVAIADTGGLPGAVIWVADRAQQERTCEMGSYISELVKQTVSYAKFPQQDRWEQCILCSLARPPLKMNSVLIPRQTEDDTSKDWTVKDASESGSILISATANGSLEIRVAPCFLAASKDERDLPLDTSIVLANLSLSDGWTWQRFEEAHAHYYAAVLNALCHTRHFWSKNQENLRLKDVLRGAQHGTSCGVLNWIVKTQKDFKVTVHRDEKQSIPKSTSASRGHTVDIADTERVHLARAGTPIIDAHFNLIVEPFANGVGRGLTVFKQYKHSVEVNASVKVKVSEMNAQVIKLKELLARHSWPSSQEWVFLWVTNRLVNLDAEPDEKLLWVGREELCEHAPLIGMRGLVGVEDKRQGE